MDAGVIQFAEDARLATEMGMSFVNYDTYWRGTAKKRVFRRLAGSYVPIADFPHSGPMRVFIIFSPLLVPGTDHSGLPRS